MTKDRTEELRRVVSENSSSNNRNFSRKWSRGSSEEMVSLNPSYQIISKTKNEEGSLSAVLKQVDLISSWIRTIEKDTALLKQYHQISQQSTRTDEGTKNVIQGLIANVKSYSSRIRGGLESLLSQSNARKSNGVNRVIETQHAILKNMFVSAMEKYHQELSTCKKKNEDLIRKHLYIVLEMVMKRLPIVPADKEVSNEQLSRMLDSEEVAIFADNYLKDKSLAMLHLKEVKVRHREIVAIEQEIIHIKEMFTLIATQISDQGFMIDTIEHYINKGADRAHDGKKYLSKAHTKKNKTRKRKIILFTVLLLILGFLIVFLLVHFTTPS